MHTELLEVPSGAVAFAACCVSGNLKSSNNECVLFVYLLMTNVVALNALSLSAHALLA